MSHLCADPRSPPHSSPPLPTSDDTARAQPIPAVSYCARGVSGRVLWRTRSHINASSFAMPEPNWSILVLLSRVLQWGAPRFSLRRRARGLLRSQTRVLADEASARHSHAHANVLPAPRPSRLICARIVCGAAAVATRDCSIIRSSACPLFSRATAATLSLSQPRTPRCLLSCSASASASIPHRLTGLPSHCLPLSTLYLTVARTLTRVATSIFSNCALGR